MLDTVITIETPEGVQLPLRPAGLCPRALAYAIDFLIRAGVYLVIEFVLGQLGKSGWGLALILFFLLEWFYPVYFELRSAATPGKRQMGLVVIHDDGTPLTAAASLLRNLLRAVDMLPGLYVVGMVSMALSPHGKRLGDLAAGTLVIYRQEAIDGKPIAVEGILPPPPGLLLEEQSAIITYAERCELLSEARARELASIMAPLLPAGRDDQVTALKKIARGLLGLSA